MQPADPATAISEGAQSKRVGEHTPLLKSSPSPATMDRRSVGDAIISPEYNYQAPPQEGDSLVGKEQKGKGHRGKKRKHVAGDDEKKKSLEDELLDIDRMVGYKTTFAKTVFFWTFVISTAGIGMLLAYWLQRKFVPFRYKRCPMHEAEKVLVVGQDKHFELADVEELAYITRSQQAQGGLSPPADPELGGWKKPLRDIPLEERTFIYKHMRFLYNRDQQAFVLVRPIDQLKVILQTQGGFRGLSTAAHRKSSKLYGRNLIDIPIKSIPQLLIEEVLHPFFIFQIYSVILWLTEDYYYYAGAIFFIASVTAVISLKDVRANLISIRQISMMEVDVTVVRDGVSRVVSSVDLQPGDIVQVPPQFILPCDLLLVNGQCVVNESMLTGESVPVIKSPLVEYTHDMVHGDGLSRVDARHTLFGGTKVVELRVAQDQQALGCVMSTGYQTSKGFLVLSILFPRPTNFKFMSESLKFMVALFAIALCGFSVCVWKMSYWAEAGLIVQRGLDLITIVVPPALPMAMSVGTAYAVMRLKKKKIFCISPPRVNMAGKINIMCFDKTGTLTEEGLDLMGVRPAVKGEFNDMFKEPPPGPLAMIMMTTHSLTHVGQEIMGDPLETKIFFATGAKLEEPHVTTGFDSTYKAILRSNSLGDYGVLHQYEFLPALQRMSVVVKSLRDDQTYVCVKGSPEALLELSDPSTIPHDYAAVLATYTHEGYRVLACGYRTWDQWGAADPHKQRRDAEHSLTFLGFIVMQNKLKPQTTGVIKVLSKASIRSVMVTGDNPLTAVCIAKECNIVPMGMHVFLADAVKDQNGDSEIKWSESNDPSIILDPLTLRPSKNLPKFGLAMTGRAFAALLEDHKKEHSKYPFEKIIMGLHVTARMSPEQKAQLVEILQSLGMNVGMCGDGANDCIALRAAHVGVSLSEAEASVSAPFTSSTPSIECIPMLLREGRSSLATSFQLFRFMALYSMTQFTTAILVTFNASFLGNWQYLYEDLWIVFPLVILLGQSRSAKSLSKKRPSGRLFSVFNLSSTMSHIALTIGFQIAVYMRLHEKRWYYVIDNQGNDQYGSNSSIFETTSLFLYANFQYLTEAFMFSLGRQWKQAIYTNFYFCAWWGVTLATSLGIMLGFQDTICSFLQVLWIPFPWRIEMLVWAGINVFMYFFAEFGLSALKSCGCFSRNTGDRRKEHKIYREEFESYWEVKANVGYLSKLV
eukprot:Phypoly_transcript_00897.p1 GENE.Phypoly_transcript_00897~~Phypoly_transcript_00897.p1  ORF type:complete len:1207 (+),score=214.54 Phypoly_transcript_00897:143-3763(+)